MSVDPALPDYLPERPVDKEARMRNQNLPAEGGVFNSVNLNVYQYAGNNPLKYVDPTGLTPENRNSLPKDFEDWEILEIVHPEDNRAVVDRLLGVNDEKYRPFLRNMETGEEYEMEIVELTVPPVFGGPKHKLLTATRSAIIKGNIVNAETAIKQDPGSFVYGFATEFAIGRIEGPGLDVPPPVNTAERLGRTTGKVVNFGITLFRHVRTLF